MRSTQQFSVTLTHEMAALVRAKVDAGEYATESEVIRDGLRSLAARDHVGGTAPAQVVAAIARARNRIAKA